MCLLFFTPLFLRLVASATVGSLRPVELPFQILFLGALVGMLGPQRLCLVDQLRTLSDLQLLRLFCSLSSFSVFTFCRFLLLRLDLFQEMRHAALLAKATQGRAEVLPAIQALELATIGAARALG